MNISPRVIIGILFFPVLVPAFLIFFLPTYAGACFAKNRWLSFSEYREVMTS